MLGAAVRRLEGPADALQEVLPALRDPFPGLGTGSGEVGCRQVEQQGAVQGGGELGLGFICPLLPCRVQGLFGPPQRPQRLDLIHQRIAARLGLLLTVNGEVRQKANTRDLIIGIADLIVFASSFYTLMPGDVLFTGTPEGVGAVNDRGPSVIAMVALVAVVVALVILVFFAIGYAFGRAGHADRARTVLDGLESLAGERYVSASLIAQVHAGLGETQPALEWLEHASEARAADLAWLTVRPVFDRLRSEPRFNALVARLRQ